jgi:hypothetical protein
LLYLLILEQFFLVQRRKRLDAVVGGLSTGFLLVALFFLKITFFAVALPLVIVRMLFFDFSRQWFWSFVAGGTALLIPMLVFLRFKLGPLAVDYVAVCHLRGGAVLLGSNPVQAVSNHAYVLLALAVSCLVLPRFRVENGRKVITRALLWGTIALAAMGGIGLMLTNFSLMYLDYNMITLVSLLPLEYFVRYCRPQCRRATLVYVALMVLFVFCNFDFVYKSVMSLHYAGWWKKEQLPGITRVDASVLRDYFIYFQDGRDKDGYPQMINDGLQLLRKYASSQDGVASFDYSNPFPVALGWRSPRGQAFIYQYGANFSDHYFWNPTALFAETTVVMIPKTLDGSSSGPLVALYSDYLKRTFVVQAESPYWVLLRRVRY